VKPDQELLDTSIKRTRKLVEFVKELSRVESVADLMSRLLSEAKAFARVKEPVLAFAKSQTELLLYFYQGTRVVEKTVSGVWSQQLRIRLNNVEDSQYLANIFGRPFGRLLSIPLKLKRKSSADDFKVSAVLFFEHSLKKEEWPSFLNFIEERLQPISIALDRILLEHDLSETALLWEHTFDGLQDPVVILDDQNTILRANKSFTENLSRAELAFDGRSSLQFEGRLYEIHRYPIGLSSTGEPTNVMCHFVDVTLAHRLQQQMIQNEKMAAIGHMAGHIAHELNNPLTGIRSLAQILLQQLSEPSTLKNDLVEVEHAAERCQMIIKNLIQFSRGDLQHKQVRISLNEIVERTLPLLKTLISRFELDLNLTAKDCSVFVEPQLMQQVIFNIIKNAAQAMGETGQLSLRTDLKTRGGVKMAQLSVIDTGAGIPLDMQKQIFDFFFTTKSIGQGTGLGLSMSKSILDRFNGHIEVKSEPGKGSEFIILLPQATNENGE
jgi:two-component system NtrC family sensor kinase